MDERALAERQIGYDASKPQRLTAAATVVEGRLGLRELQRARRPDVYGERR